MATKTISITVEAYERLKAEKKDNESFSEVINRKFRKKSLMDFYGVFEGKAGEELEKNIMENRREWNRSFNRRTEKIAKELNK